MAETWSVLVDGESVTGAIHSSGLEVLEGSLSAEFSAILEKLQTPGVNSYRHRLRGREAKDLRLLLTEDVPSTGLMYSAESLYQLFDGEIVTLTVSILDAKVRWQHVTVDGVQIVSRSGPLYGRGAGAESLHTIQSAWTFRRQREGEILS